MAVTVNLTLKKDKQKSNGEYPIYLRITENRKSKYLSTGISLNESDWNKKQQKIRKSHPLSTKLNDELIKLKLKAESKKSDLRQKEKLDARELKKELTTNKNISITDFSKIYKELLKTQDRYWEHKHIEVIVNDIDSFGHKETMISQVDLKFLESFRDYLLHTKENNKNTVRKKMQRFKGLVNEAMKQKYIKHDPFRHFGTIKREKINKSKLSPQQIANIENLELEKNSDLWHTRNYFMFSFYCAGIRFSDLCALKPENIVDGRLRYKMSKTGNEKSVKLYPQALEILSHYNMENNKEYIFPILDKVYTDAFQFRRKVSSRNVQTNKWLKKIGKKAEIQEKITFHIARHSYANVALKKGMSLYSLSKSLGHSDLKVTEVYIKSFDEELLDEEMDNVFG
ncbi:tyrosine-type recombinase/integrase [Gracilimonas sp.]|uniref:tyrosine-type recombinase/integrase n=1 Tax=Gracilimonas sp. TaxID=1974203 RepID=UPI003BA8E084